MQAAVEDSKCAHVSERSFLFSSPLLIVVEVVVVVVSSRGVECVGEFGVGHQWWWADLAELPLTLLSLFARIVCQGCTYVLCR